MTFKELAIAMKYAGASSEFIEQFKCYEHDSAFDYVDTFLDYCGQIGYTVEDDTLSDEQIAENILNCLKGSSHNDNI